MPFASVLLIALALAMDAFAVSVSSGAALRPVRYRQALLIATFFGAFQGLMPLAGWCLGQGMKPYVAAFDHWIAFGLLALVGLKMVVEAVRGGAGGRPFNPVDLHVLIALSVATSIDALIVGLGLSFADAGILWPALVIAVVTFGLCLVGPYAGAVCGGLLGRRAEIAGGLVLVGIGVKILLAHLRS